MLQYLLKISTNVFCHCCPRREGVLRGTILSSRCLASWPSPSTTVDRKRTSKRRHHVWSVERFALSFFFFRFWGVCTGVWEWMCEWMSLPCRSCAQILDRGEGWVRRDLQHPRKRHQPPRVTRTQPGEVLNPGRTGLSWRLLERPLLSGNVAVCVEHISRQSMASSLVTLVVGERRSEAQPARGCN